MASYKSTLALVPPAAIISPIELVRQRHDRAFARWPPHINLIYPFLRPASEVVENGHDESSEQIKREIYSRIHEAVKTIPPFHVSLSANPCGEFLHGKKSRTVWLDPLHAGPSQEHVPLRRLQEALQAQFAECNVDSRPFTPHLSVGQARTAHESAALQSEIRDSIVDFLSRAQSEGSKEKVERAVLDWYVDKVYVLEREGFHSRFRVIGAVNLGK